MVQEDSMWRCFSLGGDISLETMIRKEDCNLISVREELMEEWKRNLGTLLKINSDDIHNETVHHSVEPLAGDPSYEGMALYKFK